MSVSRFVMHGVESDLGTDQAGESALRDELDNFAADSETLQKRVEELSLLVDKKEADLQDYRRLLDNNPAEILPIDPKLVDAFRNAREGDKFRVLTGDIHRPPRPHPCFHGWPQHGQHRLGQRFRN